MNKIFLFNYLAGQCGDFLCQQISRDDKYYNLNLLSPGNNNNQWINDNPFYQYNLNFKNIFGSQTQYNISDQVKEQIDNDFADKHLIVPSHRYSPVHLPVNLPRIQYVQTYCSPEMLRFYYTLLCIKVMSLRFDLNDESMSRLKQQLSIQHKQKYAGDIRMQNIIDSIIEKGYIYQFEKFAIMEGMTSSSNAVSKLYNIYQNLNVKTVNPEVYNINVDDILLNPATTVADWQTYFDMTLPINVENIQQYHQANLNLIESKFNKTWDSFGNTWEDELTDWLKTMCPDHY
jgi:hypothetical protein